MGKEDSTSHIIVPTQRKSRQQSARIGVGKTRALLQPVPQEENGKISPRVFKRPCQANMMSEVKEKEDEAYIQDKTIPPTLSGAGPSAIKGSSSTVRTPSSPSKKPSTTSKILQRKHTIGDGDDEA